ncbi:MAG: hypothetical protein RL748_3297, partial [Pseudomonadota bacterium]
AARFRIYLDREDGSSKEVSLGNGLQSITWTVHVANKKAAWYEFSELQGNTMLSPPGTSQNTYQNQGVPLRNASFAGNRNTLITDPGPCSVDKPDTWREFDGSNAPPGYSVNFPAGGASVSPYAVATLGRMKMGKEGELYVLGGYGNAGTTVANNPLGSFAGADNWFDDVSDGWVRADIVTSSGETQTLWAWVVTGAPKLAPELNNISSLADTHIDLGVRWMNLCPALYNPDTLFDDTYQASIPRDIEPIFKAMKEYRWVANVDAMVSWATAIDIYDAPLPQRLALFKMLRNPGDGSQNHPPELAPECQQLQAENGFPLMPLNSGDNSISNVYIEKFMALTPTQYFLLKQWAHGCCVKEMKHDWASWVHPLDFASAGNVVGEPMAPGIEVTWSMRNPVIHVGGDPFRVKVNPEYALTPDYSLDWQLDETMTGNGCQPGDLTKRMAIPWQADFYDCSVQVINFTTPLFNQNNSNVAASDNSKGAIPLAPGFYAYWWPAQSPYNVYEGALTAADQTLDGGPLNSTNNGFAFGQNVLYHRGLNSFNDAAIGWKYLGFILNRTTGEHRKLLPFYVESERNYAAFQAGLYGLTAEGHLYATAPSKTVSFTDVSNLTQNAFPVQWLVGN